MQFLSLDKHKLRFSDIIATSKSYIENTKVRPEYHSINCVV